MKGNFNRVDKEHKSLDMIMEDSRGELEETIRNEQPEEEDFMRGK